MKPEEFCRWLQGFAELSDEGAPTHAQWKLIKEHLQLVYTKVTGSKAPSDSELVKVLGRVDHGTLIC